MLQHQQSQSSSSSSHAHSNNNHNNNNNNNNNGDSKVDDRIWVQCNNCDKWRSLPPTVNPDTLPDIWTCNLNIFDPERMACDAQEENYYTRDEEHQQHIQLKSFLRLWGKKLRTADRAEARLSSYSLPSSMTRGNNSSSSYRGGQNKRKLDCEWIRCCNPSCGKWRAIARGIDSGIMLKRLKKNQKIAGGENSLWFCSMNSWDETQASCAAPQEPLWNCRWNLNST